MLWEDVILRNGRIMSFYRQGVPGSIFEGYGDCVPACADIVLRLIGEPVGMARLRDTARMINHKHYGEDRYLDWVDHGALDKCLPHVLAKFTRKHVCERRFETDFELRTFCESRSEQKPAILYVKWPSGEFHTVVTIGKDNRMERQSIEILDPLLGHQEVPMSIFPEYEVIDAGNPTQGEFDLDAIEVGS